MLLIFGFKSYATVLATVRMDCPQGHETAAQRLHRVKRRFTLFWVPLFSTGTRYHLDCTYCGLQRSLSEQEADDARRVLPDAPQRRL